MAYSDRFAGDTHILDRGGLVDGEANSAFSSRKSIKATIRSSNRKQAATHDSVCVSVHEMIIRVPGCHCDSCNRIRQGKQLRREGLKRLRDPWDVTDQNGATSNAVMLRR